MVQKISIAEFLRLSEDIPVIDVRSPGEYAQGHIPGALNQPLFEDHERAIVGTIYKNSGHDAAVLKGFEIAGPKLADFIKRINRTIQKKELLVHCWRGGMRSEHMAWLFHQAGYKCHVLTGGYKAYRNYIRERLGEPKRIMMLGGLTGSGKTDLLRQLEKMGEQVLDLENIAHHKGSAFGALGQPPQPTNEQFENDLYSHWQKLDPLKRTWIEDESRSIGNIQIPDPLFHQMSHAPILIVEQTRSDRINRLISEYSSYEPNLLKDSLRRIGEKLGGPRLKLCLEAIDSRDFYEVADLVLYYYDKAYDHTVTKRANKNILRLPLISSNATADALLLKERCNFYEHEQ